MFHFFTTDARLSLPHATSLPYQNCQHFSKASDLARKPVRDGMISELSGSRRSPIANTLAPERTATSSTTDRDGT